MEILDYPKKTVSEVLNSLKQNKGFINNVTEWKIIPPANAVTANFPPDISPKYKSVLQKMAIPKLFSHQSEAYKLVRAGKNIVVVTPTASGKTLCYNLPVIQSILEQKETRALYLFPTKALAQDQVVKLQNIVNLLGEDIKTYTFDGDTPETARRAIRSSGHIVVTNPDMLHQGILPHHTRWIKLFENLKFVVIDEIHQYRGVFGSHFANVIRRLKRICDFYGSDPQYICSSATIANPKELADKIVGTEVKLIDKNGAPRGEKHFIFYNPPVINAQLGIRKSVVKEAARLSKNFITASVQTILFARSRLRVEILVTYLKDMMSRHRKSPKMIRGYRGGYLPLERREIEKGLRTGTVLGVVSTNALELGIDIGQLDSCIMVGYPGTVASTWQQAGRAGRRAGVSVAIMLSSSAPLDQYIINHPEYFFDKPPESGNINPDNLIILMSHVKCAAFELPFEPGEKFGIDATNELLEYLEEHNVLHRQNGRYYWTSEVYPAEEVSLRSASPENFVIIDTTKKDHKVIGEMDLFSARVMIHDEAIYIHQSNQYHVDQLDWERKKAYVRQVDVDYYTDAELKTAIKVLDVFEKTEGAKSQIAHGEVSVTTTPTVFKKIKFHTHENVGFGKISLPELELQTTSYMWKLHDSVEEELKQANLDFSSGMKGLGNVIAIVAPIYIMSDPRDIRTVPMLKSPFHKHATLFIYDSYPGGVGFSEKLYEIHPELLISALALIQKCLCDAGCPSCVGPILEVGEKGKQSTIKLIEIGQRVTAEGNNGKKN